jgi:hypothetical protein
MVLACFLKDTEGIIPPVPMRQSIFLQEFAFWADVGAKTQAGLPLGRSGWQAGRNNRLFWLYRRQDGDTIQQVFVSKVCSLENHGGQHV